MNSENFILVLVIVLVVIYIHHIHCETFLNLSTNQFESEPLPINYSTREQNCNQLAYDPVKCEVETVVPSNKIVCDKNLTPITNNEKECVKRPERKNKKNSKNPEVRLQYNFDLEKSFNNAQINDLETNTKSLNDLENDLMSNY